MTVTSNTTKLFAFGGRGLLYAMSLLWSVVLFGGVFGGVFGESLGGPRGAELMDFFMSENGLLNCISDFNEKCVEGFGKDVLGKVFMNPEIRLDGGVSIERLGNETGERGEVGELWTWDGFLDTIERFMKSHALKVHFGNMVARVFESRSKPDNLELTVDALVRGASTGKSHRVYKVVIPLILGFKVTGMIIFAIFAVKLFLVKATLISNAALLISGFILLKKLYDHGMTMLNTQHHGYLNSHTPLPNYYHKEEPGFSGYGYGYNSGYDQGGNNQNLGGYGGDMGGDASGGLSEASGGDLQGHYSHHAIAMAALNKTLMNRPKRRWWSYKLS